MLQDDRLEGRRILVVEDETDLRDALADYLGAREFLVTGVPDGREMRRVVGTGGVDLVILDIGLPGEDGLSLCRWLRRNTGCRIIMATGEGEPIDRIVGLELGADDYVVKPYDLREMLARVRSVLRRSNEQPFVSASPAPDRQPGRQPTGRDLPAFGPYRIDEAARRLLLPDGSDLGLTAAEFDLAALLAARPGRLVSRAMIAQLTDGRDIEPGDRAIDIRVARLRRKLDALPGGAQMVRTVRGEGYRYDPPRP